MYLIKTIALIYFLATSVSALAAASGSSPKGKPFVEINDQLVAVQGDVDSIKDQIESLTSRLETIEEAAAAVSEKLDQTIAVQAALSDLVEQIEAGTTTLTTAISDLELESDSLATQIAALGGSDEDLQAQIDSNQALTLSLQLALANGLESIDDELEQLDELAFYLAQEQSKIQAALDLKQNVLEGSCDEGLALTAITEDGIQCEAIKSQLGLEIVEIRKTELVQGWTSVPFAGFKQYQSINIYCPIDSISIGARVLSNPAGLEVKEIFLESIKRYRAAVLIYKAYRKSHYVEVAGQCLKTSNN